MHLTHGIGEQGGSPWPASFFGAERRGRTRARGCVCGAPFPRRRGRLEASRQRAEEESQRFYLCRSIFPRFLFVLHLQGGPSLTSRQEGASWDGTLKWVEQNLSGILAGVRYRDRGTGVHREGLVRLRGGPCAGALLQGACPQLVFRAFFIPAP